MSLSEELLNHSNSGLSDGSVDCDKENKEISSLRFSPLLFTSEEGIGLRFAMKPCLERRLVRKLVERGGGHMSATNYSKDWINLVTIDANICDFQTSDEKYYYLSFVYDSCKANELLVLDKYLFRKTTTIEKSTEYEIKELSDNRFGRTEQQIIDSNENDLKILSFISRRGAFADIVGNRLWTKAVEDGVHFGQTWESTKERFFDQIMPNIDKYEINDLHKQSFLKYYNKYLIDNQLEDSRKLNPSLGSDKESIFKDNTESIDAIATNCESKEVIDSYETESQTEVLVMKSKKSEESTDDEMSSETDVNDCSEQIETTSKYFNKKPNESKNKCFSAYLEFMKRSEQTTTPDNLYQIKRALKVSKNKVDNQCSLRPGSKLNQQNSTQSAKCLQIKSTFGSKILEKTLAEKERKISDNNLISKEEIGYKVSDISSDDSSEGNVRERKELKGLKAKVIANKTINNSLKLNSNAFRLYNLTEDELILDYIVKSQRLDELKGNSVWEEAEKRDICDGRSWQSMKERFRRYIMPNIETYIDGNNKIQIQRLIKYYYSEREGEANRTIAGSSNGYTDAEDENILLHIITKRGYDLVKGNKFWRQMESEFRRKKVMDRSWQSLKERYRKRIIPNLYKYRIDAKFVNQILSSVSGLSDTEKKLILSKCKKSNRNQTIDSLAKRPTIPALDLTEAPKESPILPKPNVEKEVQKTAENINSNENRRSLRPKRTKNS